MDNKTIDVARKIVINAQALSMLTEVEQLGYDLATAVVAWADAAAGQAGTHAYDMLAASAKREVEVTESLIHMVAATVLAKFAMQFPKHKEANVSFSPADMDAVFRDYDVKANRNGMITTVVITPKPHSNIGLMTQDEDVSDAKPQAEPHEYDRPVWAIRSYEHGGVHLSRMQDRANAKRNIRFYKEAGRPDPVIENRMCLHRDCPSERCNHEVTS